MKSAIATDNSAGITGGGAHSVYMLSSGDMSNISIGDSEADLAISKRVSLPKEWKFPEDSTVDESVVEAAGGSLILAQMLLRRGLKTAAEVTAFLDPTAYQPSGPMELLDMTRAVARVTQAIANKEKITVYGDYDVDGVTATSVMVTTLRHLGAEVDYYIPTRAEGYGLNLKAVSVLASKHRTKLIITCDCGISNFSEINFARSLGVDTVVVDHHTMPELLPPAAAILHPKQLAEDHPLYHLPGVGVAFKLAEALLEDKGEPERVPELLDLVTLGMIADMVPLVKECRYLVQIGMAKLVATQRPGLKALLAQVGSKDGGTDLVGFGLAPRINAVGRLSDANTAVKLMVTEDELEATELARQLDYENLRRQELCEQIFQKADQSAIRNIEAGDKAIAIYGEGWHHGVVGIVASRLVEKYHCPVFIGELDAAEAIVKGSARGIEGIDMYEVLKANEHLALKWGGHKMAAGFSVEAGKADLFCKGIVETCNRMLAEKSMTPTLEIDLVLEPSVVTMDLAETLAKMAPFGIGNKKPIIAMRDLECVNTRPLGKEGKHHRIVVGSESEQFECVYWNSRGRIPAEGQHVDVAFAPDINTYNGVSRLQLVLSDWRDPNQVVEVAPAVVGAAPAPPASHDAHASVGTADVPPVNEPAAPANVSANADTIDVEAAPAPPAKELPAASASQPAPPAGKIQSFAPEAAKVIDASPDRSVIWKDLRNHATPASLVQAAVRKLGDAVNVYGEGCKLEGTQLLDRTALQPSGHLLIWNYPPALQVLASLMQRTSATHIYLVGGAHTDAPPEDASSFLRKLTGLVRFAVNQRDGQADPEKMAAAMSGTKMTIALGLTILKKINLIDWFAEDGLVNLDILGQPTDKPDSLPEFRQLTNCLREIGEFRNWCHSATVSEIQLALVPAPGSNPPTPANVRESFAAPTDDVEQDTSGIYQHDTTGELSSNFS